MEFKNQIMQSAKNEFDRSSALIVNTKSDRQLAADLWDVIRSLRKDAERQKEEACRPLKQAWDDEKKPYDDFLNECKNHEQKLQEKMSHWDIQLKKYEEIERAKQQALVDKHNSNIAKQSKNSGVEMVMKMPPPIIATPKSVSTSSGNTQTRTVKKIYVPKDIKSLMNSFPQIFEINLTMFNQLGKAGLLDGREDVTVSEQYVYRQV